jgi:hypothetical protein
MMKARGFAMVVLATLAAQGAPARADETGSAAALFQTGLQAMQANRFAEACPKLSESYWLDPRPGVLFTLAECEAKWGRLASALAHYDDYMRLFASMPPGLKAMQRDRAEVATRQRAALADRVPMLALVLPASAPAGTVVRRNDVVLGAPSLGVPLPVDPGTHVVVVEVPGAGREVREVPVNPGDRLRVVLALPDGKIASAPPAPPAPAARSGPSPAAIALLAAGGAGLVVGGVTGGLALAGKSQIEAHCTGAVCDIDGKQAADRAKRYGWASTVGFSVGLASAAAGAVLWVVVPRRDPASAVRPASWSVGDATVVGLAGRM